MEFKSKILRAGSLLAAALVLIGIIFFGVRALTQRPIYIAVATTLSDPDGQALRDGVLLYVDQANKDGGINGHPIKIKKVYDDKGDVTTAVNIAHEIASDPDIAAVIGHLFSRTSVAAGAVYQQAGVPVVTGTASATSLKDNKWYFSVVPGNDTTGAFLANYAVQVLQDANATIIYDSSDPYSSSLETGFIYPFKGLGGKIFSTYDVNSQNIDVQLDTIVSEILNDTSGKRLIFVASQKNEAQKLIVALRRKGVQNPILGGNAVGGASFVDRFKDFPEEQSQPGYFTNNIYASSPVIFDSGDINAQKFYNTYKTKYSEYPTWIAAGSYDAAYVLANAIQHTNAGNNSIAAASRRSLIRDYLAGIDSPEKALKGGVSGDIYFGKQMDAVKPISVGVFSEDHFISAPTQYTPIPNIDLVANLDQDLLDGHILIVDGHYVHKTSIVYTGIEFNEISGLDESTSTYHMDFYIWFRYQGDVSATDIQFLNASGDVSLGDPLQSKDLPNNIHYQLFRVKGDFKSTFDFHNYPFDRQSMNVRFRHTNLTRDNLVYVVDAVSINQTIDPVIFQSGGDWRINKTENTPPFFPGSAATSSSLGDPKLIGLNPDTEYATFNVEIPISRDVLSFILRNLLPVFFTLLLTYMSYFLPSEEFGTRSGLLSGSILTIAFFHLGVSSSLKVGYTVALDYAFYAFYAIIMIGLLTTMAEWFLHIRWKEREEKLDGLRKKSMIAENEALIERDKASERNILTAGRIFFPASLILMSLLYVVVYYGSSLKLPGSSSQTQAAFTQTSIPAAANNKVVLTIGSWRVTDQTEIDTILAVFHKEHPDIEVKFSPAVGDQYEKILRLQLQQKAAKVAPDLFYVSSIGGRVANPQDIFANYDVKPLTGMQELENYSPEAINTWSYNGQPYALPLYAVSHGIYYNKDIFTSLSLTVPQTWDELMGDAQKIQAAGYTPFANAHYGSDKQRIGDLIFTNMAPTFIGGAAGRSQYADGKLCFNDPHVTALFKAIQDISSYMPRDAETLTYDQSLQLFIHSQAAMYFGGSFEIPTLESNKPNFKWGVFAIPAPQGYLSYVNYHIDTAIALNADSPHPAEALIFLKWLTTPEFAKLLGDQLPGLFPLNLKAPPLADSHGNDFLALNAIDSGRTDIRWPLPNGGLPDGRTLMQDAALGVMQGNLTPQQAADHLQNGLAQWYLPAQQCLH